MPCVNLRHIMWTCLYCVGSPGRAYIIAYRRQWRSQSASGPRCAACAACTACCPPQWLTLGGDSTRLVEPVSPAQWGSASQLTALPRPPCGCFFHRPLLLPLPGAFVSWRTEAAMFWSDEPPIDRARSPDRRKCKSWAVGRPRLLPESPWYCRGSRVPLILTRLPL